MTRTRRFFRRLCTPSLASLLLLGALFSSAWALNPVFQAGTENLAIRGYDSVAYFTQQKPLKGSSRYQTQWGGVTWRFASQKHLDQFKNNPQRYAPQYGGYCAYAVGNNYTASTQPEAWSIVDGKLYLNYSLGVRDLWRQNIPGYIASANKNWPTLLKR